ncbi:C39 family peptidase [Brevibacillus laterosporus]|uniref:C39 family peptidase n=1 Tax=Brevibacillus laterosporus TaxID=1465 RepID=UPI0035A6D25D
MARKTFNRDLGITDWKQAEKPWGKEYTSCGQTMADEGCIITSVAMIFDSFGDDVDPYSLLEKLKKSRNDCDFNWSAAATSYKHKYKGKKSGSFNSIKADIFDLVVTDRVPVMVRVPGHTVIVTGFRGTLSVDTDGEPYYTEIDADMFLVNDPGYKKHTPLQDVIDKRGKVEYFNYYLD